MSETADRARRIAAARAADAAAHDRACRASAAAARNLAQQEAAVAADRAAVLAGQAMLAQRRAAEARDAQA